MNLASEAATGASNVFEDLKAWAAKPFTEDMDLVHWFLIVGLVLVSVVLWNLILHDVKGAI